MLPKFEDFLYPFLLFLKDGKLTKSEIKDKVKEYFSLSEDDCITKTKSGNTNQFEDRLGWARQYFRRALFIEIPQRGTYEITQRGKDYLANHSSLCIEDLMAYPEFASYAKRETSKKDTITSINTEKLTPIESLKSAYKLINDDISEELLDLVIKQTPQFFEKLVVDLLKGMGYGGGNDDYGLVTQYSKDGGIDGIIKEDKLGLDNIYIQAKRWTVPVGSREIQQFIGVLDGKKASKGVFITTSTYAKTAKKCAEESTRKIVLIDGKQLANYMLEYNIGVSVKDTLYLKKIDTDYFDDI